MAKIKDKDREKKVMKTSERLFGVPGSTFLGMKIEDVCAMKIDLADKMLTKAQDVHWSKRDNILVKELMTAVDHQQGLLDELYKG